MKRSKARVRMGLTLGVALGVLTQGACNQPSATTAAPPTPSPAPASVVENKGTVPGGAAAPGPAVAEAKAIFAQRCVMCHGVSGHGDGAAAASLNPKPRNYSDAAWQKATDDEHIRMVIIGGGPAVGKSMMMPANPDLKDKPQVVEGLVQIVRGFGKA